MVFRMWATMVHANRFGEFEERCAGGVYLSECWMKWLESYHSIRNNLSCYLRSVLNLMDICVFQWSAAALVGMHLTAPFLSMIIDHRVTQRELLVILPALYEELISYPISFTNFDEPALPSLSKYWLPPFEKDTSPYGVEVMKRLQSVVRYQDEELMDTVRRTSPKTQQQSSNNSEVMLTSLVITKTVQI